jgi:ABC-2 type transport system ATP-binding protein
VLVTSHLLGELERTCEHVVVIDGGKLLRSSSTADFTKATALLAVEVTALQSDPAFDADAALRQRLTDGGLSVSSDGGRVLLVEIAGDDTYDRIRDAVADLGVGLVRMEQRRHRIAEVFQDRAEEASAHV